jgi:hypothetical protein
MCLAHSTLCTPILAPQIDGDDAVAVAAAAQIEQIKNV